MNTKKIMIAANDTSYVYKLRKEILNSLIKNGYDVFVVAKKLNYVNEIEEIGCKIINLEIPRKGTNPYSDINLYNNIKRIIKKLRPDIVFSYNIKPNVYFGIACRKFKIPFIPNITGLGRALEYPGILQKISIKLYKMGLKGADTILFQNEFNKDFFIKKNIIDKDSKYVILPGSGVNTNDYKKLEYPSSEIINFLFIARIRKEKGIDYFINSAKKLHEKYDNVMFNVCGLCEDQHYLEIFKKLEKEGFFKYHGEQKDLTQFYNAAYCVVHPTYYPEGMSNVLLEACSHARPIITTNRPGCREIVEDGYNGYMIDIKNQKQLDEAIDKFIRLSDGEKKQMGLNGRIKIEENFDRDIIVSEYIDLANGILAN